jgi:hypothetical protein
MQREYKLFQKILIAIINNYFVLDKVSKAYSLKYGTRKLCYRELPNSDYNILYCGNEAIISSNLKKLTKS